MGGRGRGTNPEEKGTRSERKVANERVEREIPKIKVVGRRGNREKLHSVPKYFVIEKGQSGGSQQKGAESQIKG